MENQARGVTYSTESLVDAATEAGLDIGQNGQRREDEVVAQERGKM